MSALALIAWLAPAIGALLAVAAGRRAAQAAVVGPTVTAAIGAAALAGAPIEPIDAVGGLMLLLVGGLTATVQSYALRQLANARGAAQTTALLGVAASGTSVFATAESFVAIAAGWSVASVAFLGVLAAHRHLPTGPDALRRAIIAFAVADLALWAVVVLDATGAEAGTTAGTAIAVLLVLAAAARAAQFPLHGWLVTTVAAPTPVCAFLHAGIVNAGGLLLLRQQDVLTASTPAMAFAIAIGGLTMVTAALAMAVRSDVKGQLACSTSAQMGFMLMTCGLGAWAATLIHIIGHAMYKAAGFLGAGGAIAEHARRRTVPQAPAAHTAPAVQVALSAVAPAAGLALVAAAIGAGSEKTVLLVFAWITGAVALWSALRRANAPGEMLVASLVATAMAAAYLLGATGLAEVLALPSADGHPAAWWALVPLAAALAAMLAWRHGGTVRDRLYMRAVRLSRPRPTPHWHFGGDHANRPASAVSGPSTAVAEGGAA